MGTNGRFSHHMNSIAKLTPPKLVYSKKIYIVINITSLYQKYATCGHNIIFSFDVTVIQWNISCQKGSAEAQW